MISSIILAAGESERMGQPKALLKIGKKTFLQHIAGVLQEAAVDHIVIVLGAEREKIQKELSWFTGKIVVNKPFQEGQLSSIIAGLKEVEKNPEADGAFIWPVDHPIVSADLLATMVQEFYRLTPFIVLPKWKGQRGHPVLFAKILFDKLRSAPLNVGARAVVHDHAEDVLEIETDEEGVVMNIDTPEDYQKKILKRFAKT